MTEKIYYLIETQFQLNSPRREDGSSFTVNEKSVGVVVGAFEKDYEIWFNCIFLAEREFHDKNENLATSKERFLYNIKKEDVNLLGWGKPPFDMLEGDVYF